MYIALSDGMRDLMLDSVATGAVKILRRISVFDSFQYGTRKGKSIQGRDGSG
jgi:hypothetical protein